MGDSFKKCRFNLYLVLHAPKKETIKFSPLLKGPLVSSSNLLYAYIITQWRHIFHTKVHNRPPNLSAGRILWRKPQLTGQKRLSESTGDTRPQRCSMSLPEWREMEINVQRYSPPPPFTIFALPLLPVRRTLKGALQLCGVSTWSS